MGQKRDISITFPTEYLHVALELTPGPLKYEPYTAPSGFRLRQLYMKFDVEHYSFRLRLFSESAHEWAHGTIVSRWRGLLIERVAGSHEMDGNLVFGLPTRTNECIEGCLYTSKPDCVWDSFMYRSIMRTTLCSGFANSSELQSRLEFKGGTLYMLTTSYRRRS